MKNVKLFAIAGICAAVIGAQGARAETGEIETQETQLETAAKQEGYEARLKEKYSLTDADLSKLRSQGMNDSQITIAAHLAKESGKPIDDIVKMRLEEKKGWGVIAKELGVSPKEIGQGIASMHRRDHDRKHDREGAKERSERRNERKERRAERREERAERKAAKQGRGRD